MPIKAFVLASLLSISMWGCGGGSSITGGADERVGNIPSNVSVLPSAAPAQ